MAIGNRTVHEYDELIARAFNGAVVVNGLRIVGHPSGLLWARVPNQAPQRPSGVDLQPLDRDNDWSDV